MPWITRQRFHIYFTNNNKKIEGPRWAVPFSKEKVRKYAILQYWKAQLKKVKENNNIDSKIQIREQCIEEIETTELSIKQIKNKLQMAKIE